MQKPWSTMALVGALLAISVGTVSAQTLGKTTKIEIHADGSAIWTIENKIPISVPDNDILLTISWYENIWAARIDSAEVQVSRMMEMKNFTASGPVEFQGEYKGVRYRFEWTNFVKFEDSKLNVGDVFEAGLLNLPTAADVLTVYFPSDYRGTASPTPSTTSGDSFTWYGPQSFGFGEPSVVLSPIPSIWPFVALAAVLILLVAGGWMVWFRKMFRPMLKATKATKPVEPPTESILKSDVERAVEILKEAGGRMYQTELVRRLDFSKSKVSALLGSMEGAGKIQRTRTGRKNLITLKQPTEVETKRFSS